MATPRKPRKMEETPVWERPPRVDRPAPVPLTREGIVAAALAIADAEGLVAVSLRNVAAALDAGPMRLYGYVATKDELLELMVDEVYGEINAEGPICGDWRTGLRTVAERIRRASLAHPWFVDLLDGRQHVGPNALVYLEQALSTLYGQPGFEAIDDVLQAVGTVSAYAIGAIRNEAGERRSESQSGLTEAQWQMNQWPYMQRMLETGKFPTVARVVHDGNHPPRELRFFRGLDFVLDGIAVSLRDPTQRQP